MIPGERVWIEGEVFGGEIRTKGETLIGVRVGEISGWFPLSALKPTVREGSLVMRRRDADLVRSSPRFRVAKVIGRDACLVTPENDWFQGVFDISELVAVAEPPAAGADMGSPAQPGV